MQDTEKDRLWEFFLRKRPLRLRGGKPLERNEQKDQDTQLLTNGNGHSEPDNTSGSSGQSSAQPQAPKKTVSQVLGEVTWLLTQSQIHKQLFIGDLEWFVMPPLLLEQFRVFNGNQHPVGVAFWARVSEETDARLRAGAFKLRVDEWKGGDIPWLIELIAPFGGQDEMMADMSAAIFPNEAYNFHRVSADGKREVASFAPVEKN